MKKFIFAAFLVSVFFMVNIVSAEELKEVQLTDYVFEYAAPLFDGYSYVDYGHKEGFSLLSGHGGTTDRRWYANVYQSNILRPDGTFLYNTGDFSVDYWVSEYDDYQYYINRGFTFPQHKSGNTFSVYKVKNDEIEYGIMNSDGKLIMPFGSTYYYPVTDNVFYYKINEKSDYYEASSGLIDISTNKNFAPEAVNIYLSESKDKIAIISRDEQGFLSEIDFYENDELTGKYTVGSKKINYEYSDQYVPIKFKNEDIEGSFGGSFTYNGEEFEYINNHPIINPKYEEHYSEMDMESERSQSDRVDRSYCFKSKTINDKEYYALFKTLKSSENIRPKDEPSAGCKPAIDEMLELGLLYNNDACYYDRPISKTDFYIITARMLCRLDGYDIRKYRPKKEFSDITLPYCTLLEDIGIYDTEGEYFINDDEKWNSYSALWKLADKYGIGSEWIGEQGYADTREQVYCEIYKMYNLLKEKNKKYIVFKKERSEQTEATTQNTCNVPMYIPEKNIDLKKDIILPFAAVFALLILLLIINIKK